MAVGFEFDASGLVQGLEKLANGLDPAGREALNLGAGLVAVAAKTRAPVGQRAKAPAGAPAGPTSGLVASIRPMRATGSFTSGSLASTVIAEAPYALFVEEGTAPHSRPIVPKKRKALRWPVAGGFAFAKSVRHPGTTAQPFMAPALEAEADQIVDLLSKQIGRAITKAGF